MVVVVVVVVVMAVVMMVDSREFNSIQSNYDIPGYDGEFAGTRWRIYRHVGYLCDR
jgi:hypothetical protein